MVHCRSTCHSHPRSLVSLATWCDLKHANFVFTFHSKALMIGVLLKAAWLPGEGCVITKTDSRLLAITFIYSMCFDFVVLVLTGYKLFQPSTGRSRLVVLIFNDGLVYFAIA